MTESCNRLLQPPEVGERSAAIDAGRRESAPGLRGSVVGELRLLPAVELHERVAAVAPRRGKAWIDRDGTIEARNGLGGLLQGEKREAARLVSLGVAGLQCDRAVEALERFLEPPQRVQRVSPKSVRFRIFRLEGERSRAAACGFVEAGEADKGEATVPPR